MNKLFSMSAATPRVGRGLMLAMAAGAFALAGISTASAQSTTGSVFGKAPAGYAVSVRSADTGVGRTVKVDASGRYAARELPNGVYTVVLKKDGKAIVQHPNVPVTVSRGIQVDFDCAKLKCDELASK